MPIAGILLAAGASTRMGRNKLLLEVGGETLVRRAARSALEAGLDPLIVVAGHEPERVRVALEGLHCRIVEASGWRLGQGASLSAGVEALPEGAEAAVVLLGDMPLVTSDMIRALGWRWRETGAPIVASRYGAVDAPPVLYSRSVLPELRGGSGERSGRELIRRHGEAVVRVRWPEGALADVDRPGDLPAAGVEGGFTEGAGATDEEVVARAAAWVEQGQGAALATVTSTWGSALRPAGSLLAVSGRGEISGSVSGGCVESAVVTEAIASIGDGRLRRLAYGVTDEQAWAVGLPCGGRVEVVVRPVGAALLEPLRADLAARRPVVLALDLASGGERLLHPGALPDELPDASPDLVGAVRDVLRLDRPAIVRDGDSELFLRPFQPPPRLVVVGAVHVAQALARMAAAVPLDVVVVDPRRSFASPDRFPGVRLLAGWPDDVLPPLALGGRDALVTLAHEPRIDDPALAAALRSGCFFVGALGSRRSHEARLRRLRSEGLDDDLLGRIQGPVGLPIGAVMPGEIAVSILSAVVESLRRPLPPSETP